MGVTMEIRLYRIVDNKIDMGDERGFDLLPQRIKDWAKRPLKRIERNARRSFVMALLDYLDAQTGQAKGFTIAGLAREAGVTWRTVRAWLAEVNLTTYPSTYPSTYPADAVSGRNYNNL